MRKRFYNFKSLPTPEAMFSRAMELEVGKSQVLLISGTASVGPKRQTMFPFNFRKQAEYTFKNISDILKQAGYRVKDVVRWRVYLKNISRDYAEFNMVRDRFFRQHGITRKNAAPSTCVQAKLCREDLLVEIEAIAVKEKKSCQF